MIHDLQAEVGAHVDLDLDFREKAFYDILKRLCVKYDFTYPEEKLLVLANSKNYDSKAVKDLVADKARYTD